MDPAENALDFLKSHSMVTVIEHEVERMILSGELLPGSWLNERRLAARLSVSRGPVREACRKLENAGLVRVVNNRGVFICELEFREAIELVEIRAELGSFLGRKAAENASEDDIGNLDKLIKEMDKLVSKNDVDSYHVANHIFHNKLLECSKNSRLWKTFQGMEMELRLFRQRVLIDDSSLKQSNAEHRAIVAAISSRDARKTGAAVAKHFRRTRDRMMSAIDLASRAGTR